MDQMQEMQKMRQEGLSYQSIANFFQLPKATVYFRISSFTKKKLTENKREKLRRECQHPFFHGKCSLCGKVLFSEKNALLFFDNNNL